MHPSAYSWVSADVVGIEEKLLGVFTERRVEAKMMRAVSGTRIESPRNTRYVAFSLQGTMALGGVRYGPHTALFSDGAESTEIVTEADWEALWITLPSK